MAQPRLRMLLNFLQNELFMLFPVKDFTRWHVLCPVTPIKDKNSDGGLVIGKSREEIALEEAIIWLGSTLLALKLAWAFRGQIV